MNNVRLVCGGYSVDLPTDFGIQINKSIADIREPESRSSDWTKTFTLPGTKTNNKLFTHLFDLNLSIRNTTSTNFSPDFNPNLKADALLTVDEVTQIEGFIRLLSIKVNDLNQIEYECSMHGQLADLTAKIADSKLSDLDFTEYNHIMNDTNIFNSWDTSIIKNSSGYVNFSGGAPIGEGYVYTWLDNGRYPDYSTFQTDDMSVCLYAKNIVDKIFSGAGYTYTSGSFFNTAQFRRLVVPCPTQFPVLPEAEIQSRQFLVQKSSGQTITIPQKITFQTEISDPSNQFNTTTSEFTVGKTGQYDLFIYNISTLAVTFSSFYPTGTSIFFNCIYSIYVNGIRIAVRNGQSQTETTKTGTYNITFDETIMVAEAAKLNSGDVVSILLDNIQVSEPPFPSSKLIASANSVSSYSFIQNSGTKFYNQIVDEVGYGNTLDFSGFFSEETKQAEFLRWIFRMFNLYVEPTEIDKNLVILPREEFYTNTVKDWTKKRDLSQPLDIIPMGELEAGKYIFTHQEGDDEGNKEYKSDYNRIYGDRQIFIENDFVKDEKKIETGFGASILNSFPKDDKTLTYIDNGDNLNFNTGKIRILQYAALSCNPYLVYNGKVRVLGGTSTNKTKYPYTGHLDNPKTPTSDINYGMPRFIGIPAGTEMTNNNLFNAYWSKYMSEIIDKDSKIVRGHFYLTPADMEKLSFRDLYFFDGNYFRLNKIEDYDPINPSVNICEFLFLKAGPTFTATTGSVGGGGSQGNDNIKDEKDPEGGKTTNKVISQRGFNIGQYNDAGDGIMVGNILSNFGNRNAAFATSGVTFICDDSIVIGQAPPSGYVGCNEVWMQGQLIQPNSFGTNRFVFPTANYTAEMDKDIIIFSAGGNHTITLPPVGTSTSKAFWVVKAESGGTLRIEAQSGEYIDGSDHYNINNQWGTAYLVCNGARWYALTNK
jgi:hypothetical protein